MSQTLLSALCALLLTASTAHAAQLPVKELFKGQGHIYILNTDDINAASMQDSIGCLNERGMFTKNDCAVFTRADDWPNTLSTKAGVCTFRDKKMPENVNNWYGKGSYAFSCQSHQLDKSLDDPYYTVQGFARPFVCNGNFGCHFDVPGLPDDDKSALPVWEFLWGSHQMGPTPGHLKTMWLWEPVTKATDEAPSVTKERRGRRVAKTF